MLLRIQETLTGPTWTLYAACATLRLVMCSVLVHVVLLIARVFIECSDLYGFDAARPLRD